MKRTVVIFMLPVLLLSFSGITGCRNKAGKDQKKIELDQEKIIEGQIESNVYPLPTSAEVIKMLTDLEVGFIFGITNPVENTKKYFSSTSRAINMGV